MITKDTLRFEIVTPLMVGGQTQTQRCNERIGRNTYNIKELRKTNLNINSIKGQLHWWFRTIHGYDEHLPEWESQMFGSTGGSSSLKLYLQDCDFSVKEWPGHIGVRSFGEYRFSGPRPGNYNGLQYFGYTNRVTAPDRRNPENNSITVREYIEPGGKFQIQMLAEYNLRIKLLALFWFATQFSGFGNRCRRCFGNVKITNPKKLNYEKGVSFATFSSYNSVEHYKSIIRRNIQTVRDKVFPHAFSGQNSIAAFTKNTKLFLSEPIETPDWQEAINFAGATMQKYRAVDDFEHDTLATYDPSPANLRRPIFGLPILLRYNSTNTRLTINYQPDRNQGSTRLASPILVSLTQIANKLHVQYLILDYNLNSDKIIAQYGRNRRRVRLVANAKDQFIDHLLKGFQFGEGGKVYKYNEINLWS